VVSLERQLQAQLAPTDSASSRRDRDMKPAGICWSCGEPGNFANQCGRRSSGVTKNQRMNQPSYQSSPATSSSSRVAGAFRSANVIGGASENWWPKLRLSARHWK